MIKHLANTETRRLIIDPEIRRNVTRAYVDSIVRREAQGFKNAVDDALVVCDERLYRFNLINQEPVVEEITQIFG